jgi:hypothetical protein
MFQCRKVSFHAAVDYVAAKNLERIINSFLESEYFASMPTKYSKNFFYNQGKLVVTDQTDAKVCQYVQIHNEYNKGIQMLLHFLSMNESIQLQVPKWHLLINLIDKNRSQFYIF